MLPFKTARITQVDGEHEEQWKIVTQDGNTLGFMASRLSPQEAMAIVHIMRGAEQAAYTVGKQHGAEEQAHKPQPEMQSMKERIRFLEAENLRLAELLEDEVG